MMHLKVWFDNWWGKKERELTQFSCDCSMFLFDETAQNGLLVVLFPTTVYACSLSSSFHSLYNSSDIYITWYSHNNHLVYCDIATPKMYNKVLES